MKKALSSMTIPAEAIALPTRGAVIDSAEWTKAPGIDGSELTFYKVCGRILSVDETAQNIGFRVNIPENWNGKVVQMGGAAYNGFVVSGETGDGAYGGLYCTPLEQNYATFGSDSGHTGDMWDPSFAENDEVFLNYAYVHIKKTKDAACEIIRDLTGKAPEKVYFFGASTGGREAMEAVEQYPEDYDGVLAACPGVTLICRAIHDSIVTDAQAANGGEGWISLEQWQKVEKIVYDICDELDGVKDGLIGNIPAAEAKRGEIIEAVKAADILTEKQLDALVLACTTWKNDFPLAEGTTTLPSWSWLIGGAPYDMDYGPDMPVINYGSTPTARDSSMARTAYTLLQWMCMRTHDFDRATFRFEEHPEEIRKGSEMVDAASVNYDKFLAKGGKIIMTQGTCDQFITIYNVIEYYDRLVEAYGKEQLGEFFRLYVVPGMGHVGGGKFLAKTDYLEALDKWVCDGQAPEKLTALDLFPQNGGRTRPIYPYPAFAVYNGTGDVNDEGSFHSSEEGEA